MSRMLLWIPTGLCDLGQRAGPLGEATHAELQRGLQPAGEGEVGVLGSEVTTPEGTWAAGGVVDGVQCTSQSARFQVTETRGAGRGEDPGNGGRWWAQGEGGWRGRVPRRAGGPLTAGPAITPPHRPGPPAF